MDARIRTDVHDIIRRADGVFVMFHHDERIAEIAQPLQRRKQFFVVALVQPDARFVENIQNARERAADLRGEADTLRFAARKPHRRTGKRKILQSYVL